MIDGAEKTTGPVWAVEDDPRVTRLGRFLRTYRIDEIPQFLNMLKGEMSLIGPRPERPVYVGRLAERLTRYEERHRVKPGITGLAQVFYRYGASTQDAMRKLRYDLLYAKRLCLLLDVRIMLSTCFVVLAGRGAR